MHIPDGILPAQVSAVGYAIAAPLIGYSLRRIERQSHQHPAGVARTIPKAALLTATFFVASSLYLPCPPPLGTIHFLMNGLLGAVLGYYAIPAIVIGLLFQALLLGHGGLTTLGLNTLLLGLPALCAYHLFQGRYWLISKVGLKRSVSTQMVHGIFGGLAGFIGVMGAALLFFTLVILTIPADLNAATEQAAISLMTLVNLPLAVIEGLFTASFVVFILRTKPELLDAPIGYSRKPQWGNGNGNSNHDGNDGAVASSEFLAAESRETDPLKADPLKADSAETSAVSASANSRTLEPAGNKGVSTQRPEQG